MDRTLLVLDSLRQFSLVTALMSSAAMVECYEAAGKYLGIVFQLFENGYLFLSGQIKGSDIGAAFRSPIEQFLVAMAG